MKKQSKEIIDILSRYFILIVVAIPNLFIFYFIFTPATVYSVYFLLSLFYKTSLINNFLILNSSLQIELIPACIAGAAYYLLLILNLATSKINYKLRIKMIFLSFIFLLILNIFRIFFLSILAFSGFQFFELTHKIFWYLISTLFVVGIWFFQVKRYKIKQIPLYSDLKFLYRDSIKRL